MYSLEGFKPYYHLPERYVPCTDINQLKRLKKGKKKKVPENLEFVEGMVIYLYSHYSDCYYQRVLDNTGIDESSLQQYIKFKVLYRPSNKSIT